MKIIGITSTAVQSFNRWYPNVGIAISISM